ncbi:MAG TPA: ABC transporter substrate-binding protein [Stellaceae bacterium]|jgi:NitT/TauT family transport system substrate-binding protein
MKVALSVAVAATLTLFGGTTRAESIKIGISKLIGYPGVPIAMERGYFKEQNLDPELVFFDSAQPIAVAVASGDVQFGTAGMSAGFYTLAAGGQLRMIASSAGDAPGFYNLAYVVANKAWDAGLKTPADLKGHSIAVTQVGTSLHYAIGGAAKHYGFAMSDVTVKALQSNTNVIAALTGGTVDAAVLPGSPILPPIQKGDIKLLSWVADVAPNPLGSATFTSTKEANDHGDTVKRFLVAYRHGMKDFAAAFTNAQGKREDGPTAPAILDLMSKFTEVAPTEIDKAIPFVEPEGRIDAKAVEDQIDWYRSQGLLKGNVDAKILIDGRYALTTADK